MKKQQKSIVLVIGILALAGLLVGGFLVFKGQRVPPAAAPAAGPPRPS